MTAIGTARETYLIELRVLGDIDDEGWGRRMLDVVGEDLTVLGYRQRREHDAGLRSMVLRFRVGARDPVAAQHRVFALYDRVPGVRERHAWHLPEADRDRNVAHRA